MKDFFLTFQLVLFPWWKVILVGMMTPSTDATTCTVLTVTVADHPATVIVAPTRKTRFVSIGILTRTVLHEHIRNNAILLVFSSSVNKRET